MMQSPEETHTSASSPSIASEGASGTESGESKGKEGETAEVEAELVQERWRVLRRLCSAWLPSIAGGELTGRQPDKGEERPAFADHRVMGASKGFPSQVDAVDPLAPGWRLAAASAGSDMSVESLYPAIARTTGLPEASFRLWAVSRTASTCSARAKMLVPRPRACPETRDEQPGNTNGSAGDPEPPSSPDKAGQAHWDSLLAQEAAMDHNGIVGSTMPVVSHFHLPSWAVRKSDAPALSSASSASSSSSPSSSSSSSADASHSKESLDAPFKQPTVSEYIASLRGLDLQEKHLPEGLPPALRGDDDGQPKAVPVLLLEVLAGAERDGFTSATKAESSSTSSSSGGASSSTGASAASASAPAGTTGTLQAGSDLAILQRAAASLPPQSFVLQADEDVRRAGAAGMAKGGQSTGGLPPAARAAGMTTGTAGRGPEGPPVAVSLSTTCLE